MAASLERETLEVEWVQAVKAMWVELPLEESWRVFAKLLGTPALPCTLKQQQDNYSYACTFNITTYLFLVLLRLLLFEVNLNKGTTFFASSADAADAIMYVYLTIYYCSAKKRGNCVEVGIFHGHVDKTMLPK